MGYENVREYAGGKQDWMREGLPVEREETRGGNREAQGWTLDRMITVGVMVALVIVLVVLLATRLL